LGPAPGETTPRVSRPGEIVVHAPDGFYDYEAKYLSPDQAGLVVPATLPPEAATAFQRAAVAAFEAIGAAGLSRVDGFVLPDGTVVLNEINTMPGFTRISMFPRLWQDAGMSYPVLVDDLIDQARRRGVGLR